MITSQQCTDKYGSPSLEKYLTVWVVPEEYTSKSNVIPKKIYCNIDIIDPLSKAFKNLIDRNKIDELHTWDGCFCIRSQRRSITIISKHSWAVAVDVNASENPMGHEPKLSPEFVQCFIDAGFDWGGNFKTVKDGMHFQLKELPK